MNHPFSTLREGAGDSHGMAAVEHAVVGPHRFPLFSHPAYRAKVADDRCVADGVSCILQDPELFDVINAYVEEMLAQGKDAVSEEDVEAVLQQNALLRLMAEVTVGENPYSSRVLSPSCSLTPAPDSEGPGLSPAARSRQQRTDRARNRWRSTETRAHRLLPIVPDVLDKTQRPGELGNGSNSNSISCCGKQSQLSSWREAEGVRVTNHHSKAPSTPIEPAVVSSVGFLTDSVPPVSRSGPRRPQEEGGNRQRASPAKPTSEPSNRTKDVVRVAVYSVLQQKLTVPNPTAGFAEIRQARDYQGAVDSQQLQCLSGNAYAALDVGMDGNSMCIRRRQKPSTATPTQLTDILLATGQLHAGKRGSGCAKTSKESLAAAKASQRLSSTGRKHVDGSRKRVIAATASRKAARRMRHSSSSSTTAMDQRLTPCLPEDGLQPLCAEDGSVSGEGAPQRVALPDGPWGGEDCLTPLSAAIARKANSPTGRLPPSGLGGGGIPGQATKQAVWEKALSAVRRSAF